MQSAVTAFYGRQIYVPIQMWSTFKPKVNGRGRPEGDRFALMLGIVVATAAALEAGLEEAFLAAHAARLGKSHGNDIPEDQRRYLVAERLQTPSCDQVTNLLRAQFGIEVPKDDPLPEICQFTVHRKDWAKEGRGMNNPHPSPGVLVGNDHGIPTNGQLLRPRVSLPQPTDPAIGLKECMDALMHVRNYAAHRDQSKLRRFPSDNCAPGIVWAYTTAGKIYLEKHPNPPANTSELWTIQYPHARNTILVAISMFNLVVDLLWHSSVWKDGDRPKYPLLSPDKVFEKKLPARKS